MYDNQEIKVHRSKKINGKMLILKKLIFKKKLDEYRLKRKGVKVDQMQAPPPGEGDKTPPQHGDTSDSTDEYVMMTQSQQNLHPTLQRKNIKRNRNAFVKFPNGTVVRASYDSFIHNFGRNISIPNLLTLCPTEHMRLLSKLKCNNVPATYIATLSLRSKYINLMRTGNPIKTPPHSPLTLHQLTPRRQ